MINRRTNERTYYMPTIDQKRVETAFNALVRCDGQELATVFAMLHPGALMSLIGIATDVLQGQTAEDTKQ